MFGLAMLAILFLAAPLVLVGMPIVWTIQDNRADAARRERWARQVDDGLTEYYAELDRR